MFGNRNPFPLSDAFLRRFTTDGYKQDYLKARAGRSRSFEVYDFNVKALDTTNLWTVAAGATATTWAVRAEAGGWIRGVGGTTAATSGLQLSRPTAYMTGAAKCGMAIIYRLSAITEVRFEAGLVNALPSVNTTIVNSLTTPTFNTTASAALWVFDHTSSTTTSGLYADGSGVAASRVATSTNRPAVDTVHFVAIEVDGQKISLWTGDSNQPVAAMSAGITAADGLIPVVSFKKSNTTDMNVDIDAIFTWSGRLG